MRALVDDAVRSGRVTGDTTMTRRYVGRELTDTDLEAIRAICADPAHQTRAAIARQVCRALGWVGPGRDLKDMSANVALARMDAEELIALPAPTRRSGRAHRHLEATIAAGPEISFRLSEFEALEVTICSRRSAASAIWNEMIGRLHYLGYTPASGAQVRYLVTTTPGRPIAAISFAAFAWALEDRDT